MAKFFENISLDTHMVVYGVEDTMRAFEAGSLETILVYENAEYSRLQLKNKDTDSITIIYCKNDDIKNPKYYKEGIHGISIKFRYGIGILCPYE